MNSNKPLDLSKYFEVSDFDILYADVEKERSYLIQSFDNWVNMKTDESLKYLLDDIKEYNRAMKKLQQSYPNYQDSIIKIHTENTTEGVSIYVWSGKDNTKTWDLF